MMDREDPSPLPTPGDTLVILANSYDYVKYLAEASSLWMEELPHQSSVVGNSQNTTNWNFYQHKHLWHQKRSLVSSFGTFEPRTIKMCRICFFPPRETHSVYHTNWRKSIAKTMQNRGGKNMYLLREVSGNMLKSFTREL